jgi:hypothetical protein
MFARHSRRFSTQNRAPRSFEGPKFWRPRGKTFLDIRQLVYNRSNPRKRDLLLCLLELDYAYVGHSAGDQVLLFESCFLLPASLTPAEVQMGQPASRWRTHVVMDAGTGQPAFGYYPSPADIASTVQPEPD